MRKGLVTAVMALIVTGILSMPARALDLSRMIGKWKWQDYVVQVAKGGAYGITARVVSGPSNVGMEMIRSPLAEKDGKVVGRIRHPGNGKVYNTRMSMPDANSWKLDGCTDDGACASGVFVRIK